jgi:hypothetical protein
MSCLFVRPHITTGDPINEFCFMEVGLEVKTKYKLVSRYQKVGQEHRIKIANRCSEDVTEFKYLGTTLTDQNCMYKEIKSRLNLGMLATIRSRVFCLPACCLGT